MTDSPLAVESGGEYITLPMPMYRGYEVNLEELVVADRNTLGKLIKQRIAQKYTISVQWHNLSADEKNLILLMTGENSFGIRFLDTTTDTIRYISASDGGVYRGSGYSVKPHGLYHDTTFDYYDVSMTLIER